METGPAADAVPTTGKTTPAPVLCLCGRPHKAAKNGGSSGYDLTIEQMATKNRKKKPVKPAKKAATKPAAPAAPDTTDVTEDQDVSAPDNATVTAALDEATKVAALRPLFLEYDANAQAIVDAEAALAAVTAKQSEIAKAIKAAAGSDGPFTWKGEHLKVRTRGDTSFLAVREGELKRTPLNLDQLPEFPEVPAADTDTESAAAE